MKQKPVKKYPIPEICNIDGLSNCMTAGWNEAIDQSDAYWQEKIKAEYVRKDSLPDIDELHEIIDNNTGISGFIQRRIAVAIHKRMTGGK